MKKLIKKILEKNNLKIIKKERYEDLLAAERKGLDFRLMLSFSEENRKKYIDNIGASRSQLRQDMFVLETLRYKSKGYFVEFGATNGIDLSNTKILEEKFEWNGILAEPARCWHQALRINRSAIIDTRCVWIDSKSKLIFNEVKDAELSTIDRYSAGDTHRESRTKGHRYEVKTVSLNDLLKEHNAPNIIDYLSIDTEGSEFEILQSHDFEAYKFRIITCEHNFTSNRQKIYELLTKNGYKRVCEDFSLFDDWYIKEDLI